jgi:hypothetical protein
MSAPIALSNASRLYRELWGQGRGRAAGYGRTARPGVGRPHARRGGWLRTRGTAIGPEPFFGRSVSPRRSAYSKIATSIGEVTDLRSATSGGDQRSYSVGAVFGRHSITDAGSTTVRQYNAAQLMPGGTSGYFLATASSATLPPKARAKPVARVWPNGLPSLLLWPSSATARSARAEHESGAPSRSCGAQKRPAMAAITRMTNLIRRLLT